MTEGASTPWKRKKFDYRAVADYSNRHVAESFLVNGQPLERGSIGWEARERVRKILGCECICLGVIE